MRALLLLLACLGLVAQAPRPLGPIYVTHPETWRLEIQGAPGGWTLAPHVTAFLKVVDPTDPAPPRDDAWSDPDGPYDNETEATPEAPKDPWTDRPSTKLVYWFNGERQDVTLRVGYRINLTLDVQNGENRLEVIHPSTGQRIVRTWWSSAPRNRLLVRLTEQQEGGASRFYWGGGLQVVEPDHTESIAGEPTPSGGRNFGERYEHGSPVPGTYTVRWFDRSQGVEGYEWGSGGGSRRPVRVVVEVYLDAGTEYERRWRFERLVIPGTRRVTLGSFDVED